MNLGVNLGLYEWIWIFLERMDDGLGVDVGPSLVVIASKTGRAWYERWVKAPSHRICMVD